MFTNVRCMFFKKKSPNYKDVRNIFQKLVDSDNKDIETHLLILCEKYPIHHIKYKKAFFVVMKDIDAKMAIKYAEEVVANDSNDLSFIQVVAIRQQRIGNIERYIELIDLYNQKIKQMTISKKMFFRHRFSIEIFKITLLDLIDKKNTEEIKKHIDKEIVNNSKKRIHIARTAFILLKDSYTDIALVYADIVLEKEKDHKFIQVLYTRAKRIKDKKRIYQYAKLLKDDLVRYFEIEYKEEASFNQLGIDIETKNLSVVDEKLKGCLEQYSDVKDIIYFIFARLVFDTDKKKSMYYLDKSFKSKEVYFSYEKLFDLYVKKGCLEKALSIAPKSITQSHFANKVLMIKENYLLLDKPFLPVYDTIDSVQTVSSKILYFVYNSLPYHSKGYALRTQGMMTSFNTYAKTFTIEAVSRLGYPQDIVKSLNFLTIPDRELINKQVYHRLPSSIRKGSVSYMEYIREYTASVIKLSQKEKPCILHACSNFSHALGVINAAKYLGIPSVYEIRGLWEVTAISNNPALVDSDSYKLQAQLETQTALQSDLVITITEALKKEMVQRGVPANKIEVIPNAVDTKYFKPLDKSTQLMDRYNLHNKVVIGYIGSFVEYEGLEDLIDVVHRLIVEHKLTNMAVLLVGSGIKLDVLRKKVTTLGLSKYFIFTGEIEHRYIQEYYSIIDIAPFPRKSLPVCEMVSPLKPFEAMSMGKAVVASNVDALTEIIKDNHTGLLFEKNNLEDFTDKLKRLICDKSLRGCLGKASREWVVQERDWIAISERLESIYLDLYNRRKEK